MKLIKVHLEYEVLIPDDMELESFLETPVELIEKFNGEYLGADGYVEYWYADNDT